MGTFVLSETGFSLVLLFQYTWGISRPAESTIWLDRLAWCGYFGKCPAASQYSHGSRAVTLSVTCIWAGSSCAPVSLGAEHCIWSSGSVGSAAVSKLATSCNVIAQKVWVNDPVDLQVNCMTIKINIHWWAKLRGLEFFSSLMVLCQIWVSSYTYVWIRGYLRISSIWLILGLSWKMQCKKSCVKLSKYCASLKIF